MTTTALGFLAFFVAGAAFAALIIRGSNRSHRRAAAKAKPASREPERMRTEWVRNVRRYRDYAERREQRLRKAC